MQRASAKQPGESVSQSKLISKLSKELGRNPKKTAVLSLLLAVAIWFWVPLVWKWVAPATRASVEVAEKETTEVTAKNIEETTPTTDARKKQSHLSWRNLADLFEHHHLMETAELRKQVASPFGTKKVAAAMEDEQVVEESEEAATITATPTPEKLGLSLTSTITGRKRLAMINGNACSVGTTLVVPNGDANVEWTIIEVLPDSVQLRSGEEVRKLERKPLQSSMQLTLASRRPSADQESSADRIIINSLHRD